MVVLSKIYTRTGDDGTTALGSGRRVAKYDLRVEAYGTLDETNAAIGLARLHTRDTDPALDAMLARIQNDLFDLGAELCFPDDTKDAKGRGSASPAARSTGWSARSTRSIASCSRCAPSCCLAGRRRRASCISRAPSRAAPSG